MRICIDPGHGGHDPGAVSPEPELVKESDIVLSVSQRLRDVLEQRGHAVWLTRDHDVFVTIARRRSFAHEVKPDLFLSIHANGHETETAHGFECWFRDDASRPLAERMIRAYAEEFPRLRSRGEKRGQMAVLYEMRMPAVLFELEFLTNTAGRAFLTDLDNHNRMADALADGLVGAPVEESLPPIEMVPRERLEYAVQEVEAAIAQLRRVMDGG